MRGLLVLVVLVAVASGARAQSYVELVPTFTGVSDAGTFATVGAATAWHARDRWRWHVGGAAGLAVGDEGGAMGEVRLGLEYRPERCEHDSCVYAGVDAAGFYGRSGDDMDETSATAALAVPRAGIQLGTTRAVRMGLEIPIGVGRVENGDTKLVGGFAFTFGVLWE